MYTPGISPLYYSVFLTVLQYQINQDTSNLQLIVGTTTTVTSQFTLTGTLILQAANNQWTLQTEYLLTYTLNTNTDAFITLPRNINDIYMLDNGYGDYPSMVYVKLNY